MMAEGESHGGEESEFSRPTIIVDHELARMGEEALLALSMCPDIYQRNGRLVQVVSETGRKKGCLIREPGAPAIEAIPLSQLHLILSAAADWRKYGRGDHLVPTLPHDKVVKGVFEKGRYPESLRRLESVIETPMILADGRVIQTPGYDEETGLLYIQPPDLVGHTVAEHPNREDVEEARDLLLDLVCDFCFRDETHRSAWISGVLTYFARFAIPAQAPFFLVDANTPGSGKGYLVKLVGIMTQNRWLDRFCQETDPKAEKEMIFSVAQSGLLQVLIDNIDRPIGSGAFDGALTDTTVSNRKFHTQDISRSPLFAIWWGTGNNAQIRQGADTARRIQHIRLDSPEERPEQRTGFKHNPILDYARSMRPQLVMACLTLLRGYFAAGMPDQGIKNWGSFEEWSRVIRHCLVWCGLPDPYEAHEELAKDADADMELLEELVFGWKEIQEQYKTDALTVAEVLSEMECDLEERKKNPRWNLRFPSMYSAILKLCNCKEGKLPSSHDLGKRLAKYKGRVRKGYKLVTLDRGKTGMRWGVISRDYKAPKVVES